MSNPIKILDNGHVQLVEKWGSDERVIEAARTSTQGGFVSWEAYQDHPKGDAGLLAYLYRNGHATPFEMAGMTISVQAPIMVFREWHRHRAQSYSEASARYGPLPDMHYVPTVERCMMDGGKNKQAGAIEGAEELSESSASSWLAYLEDCYVYCQDVYEAGLRLGVPKELARLCLPVGRYSKMMASTNLRNWLAFLTLRMDEKAQWEIRMYANAVGDLIAEHFPRTWALFGLGRKS